MMLDLRRSPGSRPLLVAHRGASALAPENTLAALRRAAADGADLIELDVTLSCDGHVVVIHDWHLCRTTDGCGPVAWKTLAELKALDAGSWFDPRFNGETLLTLDEALTWAQEQAPPMPLMVELKGGSRTLKRGLVEKSVQLITGHGMAGKVIFISSHLSHLRRAKAVALEITTGAIFKLDGRDRVPSWLLRHWPALESAGLLRRWLLRPLALTRALGAGALSIPATALTATLVQAAHAAGVAVSPGGTRWDYPAVIALGADTISADDPAAVRGAFLTP
jgi:glycerophosphoryl diester phosphodiesterase